MIKNIKTWSPFDAPLWLKWILFIPIAYLTFTVCTFLIYTALTFLFYYVSKLQLWIFLTIGLPILIGIISLITGGLWSSFYIGFSFSPHKIATWLLAIWFMFTSFKSAIEMCTPIPEEVGFVVVQLPCWAYILLQIYIVICLIIAVIVVNNSLNLNPKQNEKEKN